MKIEFKDLKAAVDWIGVNTNSYKVDVYIDESKLCLKCFDLSDSEVVIMLFNDSSRIAKITKTDILNKDS